MSMSNTTKRVKEIRRKTRRKFSSEEKIRIVLDGLRGGSTPIKRTLQKSPIMGVEECYVKTQEVFKRV